MPTHKSPTAKNDLQVAPEPAQDSLVDAQTSIPSALQGLSYDAQTRALSPSNEARETRPEPVAERGLRGEDPLPHLDVIQPAFGQHDLSSVRATIGGEATAAAASLGARAYTVGERVAFAASPDLRLAAHEAAHVIQQRAGVTTPGPMGEVGDEHEAHADAVADRVVAGESAAALLDAVASGGGGASKVIQRKEKDEDGDSHEELINLGVFPRALYVQKILFKPNTTLELIIRPGVDIGLLTTMLAGGGLIEEYQAAFNRSLIDDIKKAIPLRKGSFVDYDQSLALQYANEGQLDTRHRVAVALGLVLSNSVDPQKVCELIEAAPMAEALALHEEFEHCYRDFFKGTTALQYLEAHRAYLMHKKRTPTPEEVEAFTTEDAVVEVEWLAMQLDLVKDDREKARKLVSAFSKRATPLERKTALKKGSAFMNLVGDLEEAKFLRRLMEASKDLAKNLQRDASSDDDPQDADDQHAIHELEAAAQAGGADTVRDYLKSLSDEQLLKYLASSLNPTKQSMLRDRDISQGHYNQYINEALDDFQGKMKHNNTMISKADMAELRARLAHLGAATSGYMQLRTLYETGGVKKRGFKNKVMPIIAGLDAEGVYQVRNDESLCWAMSKVLRDDADLKAEVELLLGGLDELDSKATPEANRKEVHAAVHLNPKRFALKLKYIADHAMEKDRKLDAELELYHFVTELQRTMLEMGAETQEIEQAKRDFLREIYDEFTAYKGAFRWMLDNFHELIYTMKGGDLGALTPRALLERAASENPARIGEVIAALDGMDLLAMTNLSEFLSVHVHVENLTQRLDILAEAAPEFSPEETAAASARIMELHRQLLEAKTTLMTLSLKVSPDIEALLSGVDLKTRAEHLLAIQSRIIEAHQSHPEFSRLLKMMNVEVSDEQALTGQSILLLRQSELTSTCWITDFLLNTEASKLASDSLLAVIRGEGDAEAIEGANDALASANKDALKKKALLAKKSSELVGKAVTWLSGALFGDGAGLSSGLGALVLGWLGEAVTRCVIEGQAYDGEVARRQLVFNIVWQVTEHFAEHLGALTGGLLPDWREQLRSLTEGAPELGEWLIGELEKLPDGAKESAEDALVHKKNFDEIMSSAAGRFKKEMLGELDKKLPAARVKAFLEEHVEAFKKKYGLDDSASVRENLVKETLSKYIDKIVDDGVNDPLEKLEDRLMSLILKEDEAAIPKIDASKKTTDIIIEYGSTAQLLALFGVKSTRPKALASELRAVGSFAAALVVLQLYRSRILSGEVEHDEVFLESFDEAEKDGRIEIRIDALKEKEPIKEKVIIIDKD